MYFPVDEVARKICIVQKSKGKWKVKLIVSLTSTDFVYTKRSAKENITVKSVKILPPESTSKNATKDIQKFAQNLPQENAGSKVIASINIWSPPQVKNKMRWLKG